MFLWKNEGRDQQHESRQEVGRKVCTAAAAAVVCMYVTMSRFEHGRNALSTRLAGRFLLFIKPVKRSRNHKDG